MSLRNMILRTVAVGCAAVSVLTSAACKQELESTKEESAVVMTIDEYEVPYEQLRYFVCNYRNEHGDVEAWAEEQTDAICKEVMENALRALKEEYAILALAEEYGINPDGEVIRERVEGQIDAAIAEYSSTDAYVEELALNHMTANVHRFLIKVSVCNEELYYAMMEAGDLLTDESAVEEIVRGDQFIRVKQVLIVNDPGESPEKNRRVAEEVRALALDGEDFDELVAEYGEDLYMFHNPDGYYICRGVWYREFEDAAFALEIGEISDVVETDAGYSVLLRCEKEEAYLNTHMSDLGTDYRDAQLSLAIEKKAAEMELLTNDLFASYSVLTME